MATIVYKTIVQTAFITLGLSHKAETRKAWIDGITDITTLYMKGREVKWANPT